MNDQATLEIYRNGVWTSAANLMPTDPARGYRGACRFSYDVQFAAANAGPDTARAAGVSCRFPVDFNLSSHETWPAFMLDILPSGYGRQQWLEYLELGDGPAADWPLLQHGAAFPPGNLRIAEAVAAKSPETLVPTIDGSLVPMSAHPGFERADVVARHEAFVEYAFQHGIYAAGASDVQGVAPKLLLTQSHNGRWHAEGQLPDHGVKQHWLVKRPRGASAADAKILKNEAAYMQVASTLGLRVHGALDWENDLLFVSRFDRSVKDAGVERYGLESLCSLAGVAEFGARIPHETLCAALLKYASDGEADLVEYIKRDIVNVVLGNKDNHARNSAVMRFDNGEVVLSPLFDFAPMYLDPEGIARVCRWGESLEHAGNPDWAAVAARYAASHSTLTPALRAFGEEINQLTDTLEHCNVDDDIIEQRSIAITDNARQLMRLKQS